MTDTQRQAVLFMYPNHEAARILGISRERARQLRQEYGIVVTTQEAEAEWEKRRAEQYYIDFMTQDPNLADPRRSKFKEWHLAKEFAEARRLPWPPPNNRLPEAEDTKAYQVWKYAKDHPEETWEQVGTKFGTTNACAVAGRFARTHDYEWPLRGGEEWRKHD